MLQFGMRVYTSAQFVITIAIFHSFRSLGMAKAMWLEIIGFNDAGNMQKISKLSGKLRLMEGMYSAERLVLFV